MNSMPALYHEKSLRVRGRWNLLLALLSVRFRLPFPLVGRRHPDDRGLRRCLSSDCRWQSIHLLCADCGAGDRRSSNGAVCLCIVEIT